jgi:hypothetical protein
LPSEDYATSIDNRKVNNTVHFPEKDEDLVTVHTVENWK